jgi:adenylate cyclase
VTPMVTGPRPGLNPAPDQLSDASIAVLPLEVPNAPGGQDYFGDAVADDLIAHLGRVRWLYVAPRHSSFLFRQPAIGARRIGEELGVRYLLSGSILREGTRIRITTHLVDASSERHLWSARYDRETLDVFAVQDEIATAVATAIEPRLLLAEGVRTNARRPQDLRAWDLVARALAVYWRMTRRDSLEAIGLLSEAVERYPDYPPASSMLACALVFSQHMGWMNPDDARNQAASLARSAARLDDDDPWAHLALGCVAVLERNTDFALQEFRQALTLNPNFAAAHTYICFAHAFAGQGDEAIRHGKTALERSPHDPQGALVKSLIAVAHYLAGRYDEAIATARSSVQMRPEFPGALRILAASYAQAGRADEAARALQDVLRVQPDCTVEWLQRNVPYATPEAMKHFLDGIRKAGLA